MRRWYIKKDSLSGANPSFLFTVSNHINSGLMCQGKNNICAHKKADVLNHRGKYTENMVLASCLCVKLLR